MNEDVRRPFRRLLCQTKYANFLFRGRKVTNEGPRRAQPNERRQATTATEEQKNCILRLRANSFKYPYLVFLQQNKIIGTHLSSLDGGTLFLYTYTHALFMQKDKRGPDKDKQIQLSLKSQAISQIIIKGTRKKVNGRLPIIIYGIKISVGDTIVVHLFYVKQLDLL